MYEKEHITRAKANGIGYQTFYNRVVVYGWDVEEAINTPPLSQSERQARKERVYPKELVWKAKRNGIGYATFTSRIHNRGWTPEEAATIPLRRGKKKEERRWN